MSVNLYRSFLFFIVLVSLIYFQNCGPMIAGTTSNYERSLPSGSACKFALQNNASKQKLVFVIDMSGSNMATFSDPTGIRFDRVNDFVEGIKLNTKHYFGLISFNDIATSHLNDLNETPIFDIYSKFSIALSDLSIKQAAGNTSYSLAIDKISELISADLALETSLGTNLDTISYTAYFVSDGIPTEKDPNTGEYLDLDSLKFSNAVKSLISIFPGNIFFNTVYYGEQNPDAINLLKLMSTSGNGKFQDLSTNIISLNLLSLTPEKILPCL